MISGNNGKYIDPTTCASIYPWPAYSVPNGAEPDVQSAAGAGMIALGQPTIVAGDIDLPGGAAILCPRVAWWWTALTSTCPGNDKFIPKNSFTVEAWVRPDWTAGDPKADRFVLDLRDFNPGTGASHYARRRFRISPACIIGRGSWNGGAGARDSPSSSASEITLGSCGTPAQPVYLALTYDAPSQTLTLFVNGGGEGVAAAPRSPVSLTCRTRPSRYGSARARPMCRGGRSLMAPLAARCFRSSARSRTSPSSAHPRPTVIATRFKNGNGTS